MKPFYGLLFSILGLSIALPGLALGDAVAVPAVANPTPVTKGPAEPAPKILSLHPKFDFKNVDEGPDIHHEFHIVNRGKGKLIVTNVATSCGCTAAVLKKRGAAKNSTESATLPVTILPGSGGTILATYHTSGRPGHATKIITVSSNDPATPGYQLQLDMTVQREVDVQPERLYLYGVHHKEARNSSVTLLGKPGTSLNILSAQSANGVMTVTGVVPYKDESQKDPAQRRNGGVVSVLLPDTAVVGNINEEIVVKTDNPKKPEVRVAVVGEVVGRVQVEPKSIYLQQRQESPMTVRFTIDPPKGFAIRSVKTDKRLVRPSIKKTVGPDGVDKWEMSVVVAKNIPATSDGKDRILIETNDKDQPEVAVDVQVSK